MIIGISGKKQAGKDTVSGCIQHWLPNRTIIRLAFADKVKQEVAKACGVTVTYIEANKEIFRPMLQWWGTDFKRNLIAKDYWVNKWQLATNYILAQDSSVIIIAPDVRFRNEVQAIEENGGFVIRVDRPTEIRDEHPSECELDLAPFKDMIVNEGTIHQLADKVKLVLQKHSLLK